MSTNYIMLHTCGVVWSLEMREKWPKMSKLPYRGVGPLLVRLLLRPDVVVLADHLTLDAWGRGSVIIGHTIDSKHQISTRKTQVL